MIEYTVSTAQALACVYILFHNLVAVNEMTATTPHWLRVSAPLLGTMAGYGVYTSYQEPSPAHCLAAVAVAACLLAQRRKTHAHPGPTA